MLWFYLTLLVFLSPIRGGHLLFICFGAELAICINLMCGTAACRNALLLASIHTKRVYWAIVYPKRWFPNHKTRTCVKSFQFVDGEGFLLGLCARTDDPVLYRNLCRFLRREETPWHSASGWTSVWFFKLPRATTWRRRRRG